VTQKQFGETGKEVRDALEKGGCKTFLLLAALEDDVQIQCGAMLTVEHTEERPLLVSRRGVFLIRAVVDTAFDICARVLGIEGESAVGFLQGVVRDVAAVRAKNGEGAVIVRKREEVH
jgi:hypothetical protein